MKFCPECGSVRNGEDKCFCGYNYITGEMEKKEETTVENDSMIAKMMYQKINTPKEPVAIPLKELKKKKLDLGEPISVSYTTSGGMMGAYHNQELSFETKKYTIIDQPWHHAPRNTKVYKTDEKVLQEIKKLLIENNYGAWDELPIDERMFAYDAPTSSMSVRFEKGNVSIPSNVYLTKEEEKIDSEISNKILSFIKEDNLIEEKTEGKEETITFMNTMPMPMDPNVVMKYPKFCPECGSILKDNDRKCNGCGFIVPGAYVDTNKNNE